MAVKAKHSTGGEYSPDWRPKVIRPSDNQSIPPGPTLTHSYPFLFHNSTSRKSSCLHRAHPRDLPRGLHHFPPMKSPMRPLAQAGAPSSNARSLELGGRAKPQLLQQQQPPRRHHPLRPLPSRRRVRNYPHGHSGDVSTPFIFDLIQDLY
jgi:hypothetical protein